MGGETSRICPDAKEQPYDGHDEQKPRTAPYGRFDESQAHQARYEIGRPVLGSYEVIINSEPIRLGSYPRLERKLLSGLCRSPSDLRRYTGHACRHSALPPSSQLRQAASRRISRVWIRYEYSGDFAAAGGGVHGYAGQLVGSRRACRDSYHRRSGANRVGYLRAPAVDDRDDHGQHRVWLRLDVTIGDEYPQVSRPFRRCGRRGAGGSQRGRDRRVLLRADDEGSGDPLGGGKDRQLGTEGEGSRIGGKRQDSE